MEEAEDAFSKIEEDLTSDFTEGTGWRFQEMNGAHKRRLMAAAMFGTSFVAMAGLTPSGMHFADKPGEWWTMREVAQYGGWVGGGVGCLGGLLGATAGFLVSRGKGRKFVMGSMAVLTAMGVAALAAGIVGLMEDQPWHVKYPLLAVGIIVMSVCGLNTWLLRRIYMKVELERTSAKDA
jgi:hypothetical protein